MKVFWITNIPIGRIAVELFNKPMGGLWMDAMLVQLRKTGKVDFAIATTTPTKETIQKEYEGINYYLLPGGHAVYYKRPEGEAKAEWKSIFEKEKPDVLQIWGTEYSHAVPALKVAKEMGIPSVVYIQGVMSAIEKYADGLVKTSTRMRYITLRDIYRNQLWLNQNGWFKKRAKVEKQILELSGNIVVENNWAEWMCKAVNPGLGVFKIPLNINEVFFEKKWDVEKMEPHSIICNASGTAYKGLHVLLDALVLVKKECPDVKLYVPGGSCIVKGIKQRQSKPGYWSFITDKIKKLQLIDNVFFTGYQTPTQLAERLSKANVFVLCSSVENHSSSLKEAMAVGVPSIASQVGGVMEYLDNGECGFSYRYGEYECIAGYILKLFKEKYLCERLSTAGQEKIRENSNDSINELILSMYVTLSKKQ